MNLNEFISIHNYKLKDNIDFEVDRYGDGMISVTTVLQLIYDPKFDYVLRNNKEAIDKACKEGTHEHYRVEKFYDKDSGVKEMNPNFMKFISLYNVTPLKREKTVYRKYNGVKFRGTIDMIGHCEYYPYLQGTYNIDWKNSKTQSMKYLVQLAGYKWMNRNDGLLVYGKDKLIVKEYTGEYDQVWQELVDYFINLYLGQKK